MPFRELIPAKIGLTKDKWFIRELFPTKLTYLVATILRAIAFPQIIMVLPRDTISEDGQLGIGGDTCNATRNLICIEQ